MYEMLARLIGGVPPAVVEALTEFLHNRCDEEVRSHDEVVVNMSCNDPIELSFLIAMQEERLAQARANHTKFRHDTCV